MFRVQEAFHAPKLGRKPDKKKVPKDHSARLTWPVWASGFRASLGDGRFQVSRLIFFLRFGV